jgi:glycosyltransferase involved in cell wall biosynthesis
VPVVATRCCGPKGIITHGTDGFLVPRDDVEGLAAQLQALLDSPGLNEAIGRQACATISPLYRRDDWARAFLETWDRLLTRAQRR